MKLFTKRSEKVGASADELGLGLVETQRCLQNIAERWGVIFLLIVAEKVRGGEKRS